MERSSTSRPLPTYAEEVLDSLKSKIGPTVDALPRDEVEAYLHTEGFEDSTIDVALDELLNRGYIYVVNDQIRLTDS
ncbi:hypothetical protein M0R89_21160 (plasmid) [Halorussus limi]|uniref:Uncharacterized protein n=1 Tax=Halorussus limi TaxID=2938695 RepID=A0A8U0I0J6_9EURY|nr:hypothetical protein [Halorussus limi]UPV76707.1 hypothetical protein M0R89_21160 [Halorussus limi]